MEDTKCCLTQDKITLLGKTTLAMIIAVIVSLQLATYNELYDTGAFVVVILLASYLVYTVYANAISALFLGAVCMICGIYLVTTPNDALGVILGSCGVLLIMTQLWWADATKQKKLA